MTITRTGPRLTLRQQLSRNREFRGRELALEVIAPQGVHIKRAEDFFSSGIFAAPLNINGYKINVFTPKGTKLNNNFLIGKSIDELDEVVRQIDARQQSDPLDVIEQDLEPINIDFSKVDSEIKMIKRQSAHFHTFGTGRDIAERLIEIVLRLKEKGHNNKAKETVEDTISFVQHFPGLHRLDASEVIALELPYLTDIKIDNVYLLEDSIYEVRLRRTIKPKALASIAYYYAKNGDLAKAASIIDNTIIMAEQGGAKKYFSFLSIAKYLPSLGGTKISNLDILENGIQNATWRMSVICKTDLARKPEGQLNIAYYLFLLGERDHAVALIYDAIDYTSKFRNPARQFDGMNRKHSAMVRDIAYGAVEIATKAGEENILNEVINAANNFDDYGKCLLLVFLAIHLHSAKKEREAYCLFADAITKANTNFDKLIVAAGMIEIGNKYAASVLIDEIIDTAKNTTEREKLALFRPLIHGIKEIGFDRKTIEAIDLLLRPAFSAF